MALQRSDLIHPELSYQIVGSLFEVFNTVGPGQREEVYQRAVATDFRTKGLRFREQVPFSIRFKDVTVGKGFLDFVVEEKIVLELKQGDRFRRENFKQVDAYLQATGLALAILANFTTQGVVFRRAINTHIDPIKNTGDANS